MAISDHVRARNVKQMVRIITCDPATRRIEGSLRDGGMAQIKVAEVPALFRWPKSGEVWSIKYEGDSWVLGARFEHPQDGLGIIEELDEGTVKIASEPIVTGAGNRVVTTKQADVQDGYGITWSNSGGAWIPTKVTRVKSGPTLRSSGTTTVAWSASTDSDTTVVNHGLGATPTLVIAQGRSHPSFAAIAKYNTFSYNGTSFSVNAVTAGAVTQTITVGWVAYA